MLKNEMTKRRYVLTYTVIFALFAAGVFFLFIKNHKSLVWNQDGGPQYVPYLAYFGRYLRQTLSGFLKGDFHIRMFDFNIGFGSDVGTVVKPHPVEFLSVFVPTAYTEIAYNALILLRFYLAGLTFSLFCFLWKKPSFYVITGSMIYVFCGYMLLYGVRHPTFSSPLVCLPLLLYTAERMMRRRGFALFSLTVCITFMSNYYYMYMCTIVLLIYVLLRFPALCKEHRVKAFFGLFVRMGGAYLLGTAMNMATLLPIIRDLASSARLAGKTDVGSLWRYDSLSRYYIWALDLITPVRQTDGGVSLNFASPVLPAAAVFLGTRPKKHAAVKIGFFLCIAFLLVPAGSYLMTGFSAVNGRWIFAFAFVLALIFVLAAEDLCHPNPVQYLLLAAFTGGYFFLAARVYLKRHELFVLTAMILLALLLLAVVAFHAVSPLRKAAPFVFLVIAFVSVSANSYFMYSGRFENVISEYLDSGTSVSLITSSEFSKLQQIPQDEFWRADSNLITSNKENYPVLLGYNGTSVYNSVISGPMTYALLGQESVGLAAIHRIQGLDGRSGAEALANVRYFLTTSDGDQHVPYGFEKVPEYSDEDNAIWENQYSLPFGYTYDTYISRTDYEALSAAEKEQVMLHAAVVDKVPEGARAVSAAPEQIETVAVALPDTGNQVERTQSGYKALAKNASVAFPYERKAGYQAYVRFSGFYNKRIYTFAYVYNSDLRTTLNMRGPGTIYTLNRKEYTVNLGYDTENRADTVTLEFERKGTYYLEGIEIIYVPMDGYEDAVAALGKNSLKDPVFTDNTITGTVSLEKPEMMVFSIPYSEGWSVYVDGKPARVENVNVSYMGVMLESGDHSIELSYLTPGAAPGRLIALIGWVLFIVLACVGSIRRMGQAQPVSPDREYERYSRYAGRRQEHR